MKRLLCAGALVALSGAVSAAPAAQPSDRDRTEALARRANERLQALQQEAERLASEERTILGDLRKLEIAREIKTTELNQATRDAEDATRELSRVNDDVERLEKEDVSQRPDLRARLIELYKLGQGRYLRLLLSTSEVRNVGQAARMVGALATVDRGRVLAHAQTLSALRASRASLEGKSKSLAAARVAAERAGVDATRSIEARNQLIANIDRERDLNAQLAGELETAQQKLRFTLREAGGAPGADSPPPTLPIRAFRGDLDWPVAGTVRTPFGRATPGHVASNGIEIAADDGATVAAVHEGQVAFAGPFAGFGNLVILQHDADTFSLYGNLSDTAVSRGARVERGQALGGVGASPTGPPGLYFEIRVSDQAVDPLQWLKKR